MWLKDTIGTFGTLNNILMQLLHFRNGSDNRECRETEFRADFPMNTIVVTAFSLSNIYRQI